jgi:hypothetical protein
MTMEPTDNTTPAAEDQETASRWEDYIDVYISPAELFRRRAADGLRHPLVTLLLLATVFYFVLLPANSMIMRASMAENPEAAAAMESWTRLIQVIGGITVPITYLVIIGFAAAVLWLVGRVAELRTDYSRTMLITTYAAFVLLLGQVAGSLAVMLHGEAGLDIARHMSFGPARFLAGDDTSRVSLALMRRFELFTLWQAALWAIGIAVIYRTSRVKAAVVAAVAWLLIGIPSVLMALLNIGQGPRGG